ncbi:MAG TPA: rod shape-determining protein MreC [Candidatus Paceibacterota bacterium]|nr:rod shape-determining protein MreC [Candidatus Paceibacterota bacterium]
MKRQFSRSGNRALLSGGRVGIAIVVLAVLVILGMRTFLPDTLVFLSRPLLGVGSSLTAAVGSATGTFENKADLEAERDALRLALLEVENENAVVRAQLADMTKLVGTTPAPDARTIAGVVARPPVSPYDTLVVEAGQKDGVRVGAFTYGTGGVPIGTVSALSGENAHVALFSAPGRETQGWAGEARIPVVLTGAGAGAFRATVAKDAGLQVGEQVFVPGPGALPIGTVTRIDTNPSFPEAYVYIRPLINPFSLTWVAIDTAGL